MKVLDASLFFCGRSGIGGETDRGIDCRHLRVFSIRKKLQYNYSLTIDMAFFYLYNKILIYMFL